MNLAILGGMEAKTNQPWVGEVEALLGPHFDSVHTQTYQHWGSPKKFADIEQEAAVFGEAVQAWGEKYVAFAKSFGTLVVMKAVTENIAVRPVKAVFVGMPLDTRVSGGYGADWLDAYDVPTLFVHQEDDKYLEAERLKELLDEHNMANPTLHVIEGSDHVYSDIEDIRRQVIDFVGQ